MSELTRANARQQYQSKRSPTVESDELHEEDQEVAPDSGITCTKCQQVNPARHRFCRSCGSALWRACAGCENERPVDESFCAMCGASLVEIDRNLLEQFSTRLADIEQLVASQRLHEAAVGLRAILAAERHDCLAEIRTTATALLERLNVQVEELRLRAASHLERGRQLLESRQYAAAEQELGLIPAEMRDEETKALLAEANAKFGEIAVLKARVCAPKGIRFEDRMQSIAKLLTLQPDDPLITRWAVQARDQVVQLAHKRLQQHEYRLAVELLRSIPEQVVDSRVTDLRQQAAELDFLWSEMELAPTITEATLRTAQRLLKLAPENPQAQKQFREMVRRFQAARDSSATSPLTWAPCPDQPYIGTPVYAFVAAPAQRYADAETRRRFEEQPGRYCVASGLALQSVNRAQVPTSLMPARNTSVLGMLRAPVRERPAKAGWGLDLSVSGLKAVRITLDADDRPTIARVAFMPHRLVLTHPDAAGVKKALLLETLKKFIAEHNVESSDRVAISWPTIQSFVRFLSLPLVEGKRGRDMLELESRQQIPMPLDQVTRDTFTFRRPDFASRLDQQSTLLLAARAHDVTDYLSIFQGAGINVHIVQCDAVALHNWVHFDRLASMPEETADKRPEGFVVIDVGAETTNVLFSFRNAIWFRSVRTAGDDLVSAFVHRFKLTRETAEQLACNPAKAKRLSDVHEEACQVYQKLAAQIEGCLSDFKKNVSAGVVREMLLVGGAGPTPGLLRYLRYGR